MYMPFIMTIWARTLTLDWNRPKELDTGCFRSALKGIHFPRANSREMKPSPPNWHERNATSIGNFSLILALLPLISWFNQIRFKHAPFINRNNQTTASTHLNDLYRQRPFSKSSIIYIINQKTNKQQTLQQAPYIYAGSLNLLSKNQVDGV